MLTNLSHSIDRGLTHLFLGRTSHTSLHTSGVTTRMAALGLYHCRRNVRDRDHECDRGISWSINELDRARDLDYVHSNLRLLDNMQAVKYVETSSTNSC